MKPQRIETFARKVEQVMGPNELIEFQKICLWLKADSFAAAEALFRERMAQKARERTT